MEVKKAIKKIVALGVGATMLGATVLGAMAACDLSMYPEPFVVDGEFDGLLVVGDTSTAADTLGVADVFGSLQFANKVGVGVGAAAVAISEGYQVERAGDDFNLGEEIADIKDTAVGESDVPSLLMDGTYDDNEGETDNEVTYTQEVTFETDTSKYLFDKDDTDDKVADSYLRLDRKEDVYTFELDFDDAVDFVDADDLKSTKIEILNQLYTITKVGISSNLVDSLTLLAGDTVIWLTEGDKITKLLDGVEHEIFVVDVSENEDSCGVSVDGQVVWIDNGRTETINGIEVGVTDAISVHTATQDTDVCELNIGATELVLEDGNEVKVGGVEVDGSEVTMTGTTANEWEGFTITYAPQEQVDLKAGDVWQDPVFNSWKLEFANEVAEYENPSLTASGDNAYFTFNNPDGEEVEIGWYYDDTDADGDGINETLGWDVDEPLFTDAEFGNGASLNCTDYTGTGSGTAEDCEGVFFLLVDKGEVAHIMELDSVDVDDEEADFYDVTYGKSYDNIKYNDSGVEEVSIGSIGTFGIDLVTTAGDITFATSSAATSNGDALQLDELQRTNNGAALEFGNTGFTLEEEEEGGNYDTWQFDLAWVAGDEEIEFDAPYLSVGTLHADGISESDDNKDDKWYVTEWGTKVKYDSDGDQSIEIWYPEEQAYANVFIAPVSASITVGAAGETASPVRIDTGAVIFAKEVPSGNQNMILVGGPCVNNKAAEVMGNPADCTEGFEEGKAMIKCFDQGDKVALVVAGYSGTDTRAAARYLADYAENQDKFLKATNEISLSVTSLDSVTATIPTAE
ncbi:MAG: hypothetical protein U9R08_00580 [Nanoarchaeota archaeon]|nr:hypothetical protein [Nanoarchaeota archaeon]